jgi:hypothetical protein
MVISVSRLAEAAEVLLMEKLVGNDMRLIGVDSSQATES